MKTINIYALEAGSGHACGLAKGLSQYGEVKAHWWKKSAYGSEMDNIYPGEVGHFDRCEEDSIIVGCGAFDKMKRKPKRATVIVTDGGFMRNSAYYNSAFKNYKVFCHPCKIQFATVPAKECYQPLGSLEFIKVSKNKELTVGHSPFSEVNARWKGTAQIIKTVLEFVTQNPTYISFDLITNIKWIECLERKSKCHIFVDQIDHFDGDKFGWRGGIGKSGLEAMLLDCLVICRGWHEGLNIPHPPIAWCTKETFRDTLDFYIHNPIERRLKIEAQKEWALKYLSYEFGAKNIIGAI